MAVTISIIVSMLALLATFYQLHLQRIHNEKSLKPLGQITLVDHNNIIAVHLYNNGLGPLIVDRFTFSRRDNLYTSIKDCLDLDPRSYMHMAMDDLTERVVLPSSHLTVFEKNFADQADDAGIDRIKEDMNRIRLELSPILLKVDCRDIYDNKITLERSFKWFSRHMVEEAIDPHPNMNSRIPKL